MSSPYSLASHLRSSFRQWWWVPVAALVLLDVHEVVGVGAGKLSIATVAFVLGLFYVLDHKDYSAFAFGTRQRVATDDLDAANDVRCDGCGTPIEAGVRRTYAEQQVVLGVPVRTLDWGANCYCAVCASNGGTPSGENEASLSNVASEPAQLGREALRTDTEPEK